MSNHGANPDDRFSRRLANYHEAITRGDTGSWVPDEEDSLPEFRRAQQLLCWLEEDRLHKDRTTGHLSSPQEDTFRIDPTDGTGRLGRFHLIREVGRGGNGIVFLAEDPHLNRQVAVKIPKIEHLVDEESGKRFLREAQAAAGLDHPNIVSVFEVGEAGGVGYIVSSYCEGPSLADWIKQQKEPLPARTAAKFVAILAEALAHTHRCGVIHRDIKPANILLSHEKEESAHTIRLPGSEGVFTPIVTDFGLAKLVEGDATQTKSGVIAGTPAYMAPEQAAGRRKDIGAATDVHALGVLLYELLTRRLPHSGATNWDTLRQIIDNDPIPLRQLRADIPLDLEVICSKCLQKEPSARFTSMQELADDLHRFLRNEPIHARATTGREKVIRWARRKPALAALSLVSTMAILVLVVGSLIYGVHTQSLNNELLKGLEREKELTQKANKQRSIAEFRKKQAEQGSLELRQQTYVNTIGRTTRIWKEQNHSLIREMLRDQTPKPGDPDQRGFEWYYLWSQGGKKRYVVKDPADPETVRFSADGTTCVSIQNNNMQVWELPDMKWKATFELPSTRTFAPALSPDGRLLLAGHQSPIGDKLKLRNLTDISSHPVVHPCSVHDYAFVPGKSHVALLTYISVRANITLQLWDYKNQTVTEIWTKYHDRSGPPFVSPDGRFVGLTWHVKEGPTYFRTFDLSTNKHYGYFFGELAGIRTTVEGKHVALVQDETEDGKRQVHLLELELYRRIRSFDIPGDQRLDGLALTSDGQWLTTLTRKDKTGPGRIRIVNTISKQVLSEFDTPAGNAMHLSPYGSHVLVNLPDRKLLVEKLQRHPFDLWPGPRTKNAEAWAVAFSPDGNYLATGFDDINGDNQETFKLWDVTNGTLLANLPGHLGTVMAAAFSPDGKTVATASYDSTVRLWDVSGRTVRHILKGHIGPVRTLSFSPDGNTLATAGQDKQIRLWDVDRGKLLKTFSGYTDSVRNVQFHPTRPLLASASNDKSIRLWNWRTGQLVKHFPLSVRCRSLAFHPNGNWLVCGREDGPIEIRDSDSGRIRKTLTGHSDDVRTIVFSPDGRTMASGCRNGVVRLWQAATGAELMSLQTTGAQINSLTFSPNGRILAGASHDSNIILWQCFDGR